MGDRQRSPRQVRALISPRKQQFRWCVIALIIVCVLFAWRLLFGVHVIVHNLGPGEIQDVKVFVTGRTYNLGTIINNQRRSVVAEPTGDSNVELEFIGTDGDRKRHTVNCYFGSGQWNGRVIIEIEHDEVTSSDAKINFLAPYTG